MCTPDDLHSLASLTHHNGLQSKSTEGRFSFSSDRPVGGLGICCYSSDSMPDKHDSLLLHVWRMSAGRVDTHGPRADRVQLSNEQSQWQTTVSKCGCYLPLFVLPGSMTCCPNQRVQMSAACHYRCSTDCVLLLSPVFSCVLLCSRVFSCVLLCSRVFSCVLLCSRVFSCAAPCNHR